MSPEVKSQVWAKTNGHCWYCGKLMNPFDDFTVEHQHSRKNGGGDELENLVPACGSCNSTKNAKGVEDFRAYLVKKGDVRLWGEALVPVVNPREHELQQQLHEMRKVAKSWIEYSDVLQMRRDDTRACLEYADLVNPALGGLLFSLVQEAEYWTKVSRHYEYTGTSSVCDIKACTHYTDTKILAQLLYLEDARIIDLWQDTGTPPEWFRYRLYMGAVSYATDMIIGAYVIEPTPEEHQEKRYLPRPE